MESSFNTIMYLFEPSFDPTKPAQNLMDFNVEELDFGLQANVPSYVVVTTVSGKNTRSYRLIATCSGSVRFTRITGKPYRVVKYREFMAVLCAEYEYSMPNVTIKGSLNVYNPTFVRPQSDSDAQSSLYDVFRLTTSTTGNYTIESTSSFTIYTLLYSTLFNSSDPSANLLEENGANGNNRGLSRIRRNLAENTEYYIVISPCETFCYW